MLDCFQILTTICQILMVLESPWISYEVETTEEELRWENVFMTMLLVSTHGPVKTELPPGIYQFGQIGRRQVTADFTGGRSLLIWISLGCPT